MWAADHLTVNDDDYTLAPTRRGIVSICAFVAATLVLALTDALTRDV
jgi:hypothetical protein